MFKEIKLGEARKLPSLKDQVAGMEHWPEDVVICVPVTPTPAPAPVSQLAKSEPSDAKE